MTSGDMAGEIESESGQPDTTNPLKPAEDVYKRQPKTMHISNNVVEENVEKLIGNNNEARGEGGWEQVETERERERCV